MIFSYTKPDDTLPTDASTGVNVAALWTKTEVNG